MKINPEDIGSFKDKIVIITGGSSGIGWATTNLFASKGAKVIVADLQQYPKPDPSIESNLSFITTDVTSWESQLSMFKQVLKDHGKIDIVLANAGIGEPDQPFEDRVDPKTGDPEKPTWITVDVNLTGCMITTKLAMHFFRKTPQGGVIILTGSRASYGAYNIPVYTATKHGVLGMMRGLRLWTPQWNIRINLVAPGVTFTNILPDITEKKYDQIGLWKQGPEFVARAIAYMAQEPSFNGKALSVNQGVYRELEDPISGLRDQIYGEDDWKPANDAEMDAALSPLITRW